MIMTRLGIRYKVMGLSEGIWNAGDIIGNKQFYMALICISIYYTFNKFS